MPIVQDDLIELPIYSIHSYRKIFHEIYSGKDEEGEVKIILEDELHGLETCSTTVEIKSVALALTCPVICKGPSVYNDVNNNFDRGHPVVLTLTLWHRNFF